MDTKAIIAAVFRFNAARNEYNAAIQHFRETCPDDVMVLHCLPGEEDDPDTLWWSYSNPRVNDQLEGPARGVLSPDRSKHLARFRVVRMSANHPDEMKNPAPE